MANWIRGECQPLFGVVRAFAMALLVLAAVPGVAAAHKDGLATDGCSGCHSGGKEVKVTITASMPVIALGQTVRLSVAIEALNGDRGGFYLRTSPGVGKLAVVPGEPTKLNGADGVTHSSPKASSGPVVTFAVDWTAPTQPGDVEFTAFGLSANGDGKSSGDGFGSGYLSAVFGCTGSKYYPDYDLDTYGSSDGDYRMACSPPANFATVPGDCDNYDPKVHPGAKELCNTHDDNCDGRVDEDLPITKYCEDNDGDGHGISSTKSVLGCGVSKGFGLCDDDCNDADATVYPTAQEMCNFRDDNCNTRVDENARASCGQGWCRRSSESCSDTLCVPGEPRAEECNAFDDDCDGVIDNGSALCGPGKSCREGVCLVGPGGAVPAAVDAGAPGAASEVAHPRGLDGGAGEVVPRALPTGPGRDAAGCAVAPRGRNTLASALLWLLALALYRVRRSTRPPARA
jgi:hypothetical protein